MPTGVQDFGEFLSADIHVGFLHRKDASPVVFVNSDKQFLL